MTRRTRSTAGRSRARAPGRASSAATGSATRAGGGLVGSSHRCRGRFATSESGTRLCTGRARACVALAVSLVLGEERGSERAHVAGEVLDGRECRRAGHHLGVALGEVHEVAGALGPCSNRLPVRAQGIEHLGLDDGRSGQRLADGLERPLLAPGAVDEHLGERLAVVGEQHARVGCAAHLDVEQRLVAQPRAVEHREHRARGLALRGMHGRAVGVVEVTQLRVGASKPDALAVLGHEVHPAVVDGEDARGVAVDEVGRRRPAESRARGLSVAGPADALARADAIGGSNAVARVPEANRAVCRRWAGTSRRARVR